MTLPLELGGVGDSDVRRAFEEISKNWPVVDKVHLVGGSGEPAFQNSWVNFGGAGVADASFYRQAGRVYLDGYIKSGTINTAAFTLPTGYRPGGQQAFVSDSNGAFGVLIVNANGDVIPSINSNVIYTLSGFSFRVA
jgi:hypothetical protein